jgi:phosphatidylglycerol:prolipoprotein diacylglycerol transferase
MMPVFFSCRFFSVYAYGVFVVLAFIISSSLLLQEARRRSWNEGHVYDFCIVILIGGIIFARFLYVILHWGFFMENPIEIIMLQHGGLVWFGGLTGAVLCGLVYIKFKKLPALEMFDLFAPYAALAQGIGRIGCLFNGCCHGKISASGIYFPVHGHILFPSQIIDTLSLLLIFAALRLIQPKARKGEVFCSYILLASLQRFLMEYLRGDLRPFYGDYSIFQWISYGLFISGLGFYLGLSWKRRSV